MIKVGQFHLKTFKNNTNKAISELKNVFDKVDINHDKTIYFEEFFKEPLHVAKVSYFKT